MIIRKATIKDFEQLKQLRTEFFLWGCELDKRLDPEYVKRGAPVQLAKRLKNKKSIYFVAEEKGKLIGYAGATVKKNPSSEKPKIKGYLFNWYVQPQYQRGGIGKKLLKAAAQWLKTKGVNEFSLHVHANNKKAHKIYKKLGFREYLIEMIK